MPLDLPLHKAAYFDQTQLPVLARHGVIGQTSDEQGLRRMRYSYLTCSLSWDSLTRWHVGGLRAFTAGQSAVNISGAHSCAGQCAHMPCAVMCRPASSSWEARG